MKRIYVFDVDNTIFSSKHQKVHSQTFDLVKLIKEKDNILVLATGRGPAKLDVIGEILPYFDYLITVNGSLLTKGNEVVYEHFIENKDIEDVIRVTNQNNISLGMVGKDGEAITFIDQHVKYGVKGYSENLPLVDPNYYKKNHIYQLWVFHQNRNELIKLAKQLPQFDYFFWHQGGMDLTNPNTNKAEMVKILKDKYFDHQLICVGDGHNDMEMIKLADIGIAMDNSGFIETKNAADLIAPHIDDNNLFDFFIKNKLI